MEPKVLSHLMINIIFSEQAEQLINMQVLQGLGSLLSDCFQK